MREGSTASMNSEKFGNGDTCSMVEEEQESENDAGRCR